LSAVWRAARIIGAGTAALMLGAMSAIGQVPTHVPPPVAGAPAVTIERIKVHAPTIVGNLEGDSADRDVLVMLPPSYA
ncbi:hypothetical protein JJD03_15095, partial [Listeria monocytogenes]